MDEGEGIYSLPPPPKRLQCGLIYSISPPHQILVEIWGRCFNIIFHIITLAGMESAVTPRAERDEQAGHKRPAKEKSQGSGRESQRKSEGFALEGKAFSGIQSKIFKPNITNT